MGAGREQPPPSTLSALHNGAKPFEASFSNFFKTFLIAPKTNLFATKKSLGKFPQKHRNSQGSFFHHFGGVARSRRVQRTYCKTLAGTLMLNCNVKERHRGNLGKPCAHVPYVLHCQ